MTSVVLLKRSCKLEFDNEVEAQQRHPREHNSTHDILETRIFMQLNVVGLVTFFISRKLLINSVTSTLRHPVKVRHQMDIEGVWNKHPATYYV